MLRGRYRLNVKQNFCALHNNMSWHIQMLEIGKNPNQNMYSNAKKEVFEAKKSLGLLTSVISMCLHLVTYFILPANAPLDQNLGFFLVSICHDVARHIYVMIVPRELERKYTNSYPT